MNESPATEEGAGRVDALEREGARAFGEGRYAEAHAVFAEVAAARPASAGAHSNLGAALGMLGRLDEALASYQRAIALDRNHTVAHLNVANLLGRLGRPQQAIETFRAAQAQFPANPWVHYSAGRLYYAQGLRDEALAAFARTLALDDRFAKARWMQAIAVLPQAYGPGEDPDAALEQFARALDDLEAWFADGRLDLGPQAVGEGQPFYLAFHERDNRALLARYGDLCEQLMRPEAPPAPTPHVAPRGPVRLAIVSGHLYDQSVWTALVRGWCAHFDRDAVELHLFHTGQTHDRETEIARGHAASFHMGLGDTPNWVRAIGSVAPEVVLYPEIGMDMACVKLACLRLAPTQLVSWGHPETSGLPTLDGYVSAAAFEPPGAQANYRERLLALPGIGCYYDPLVPEFTGIDWAALGLDPFVPRLLCAGTPYKYMPRDDDLLVDIARQLRECHFLFFVDQAPHLSLQLHARMCARLAAAGLDADRFVKLLPRQSRADFFGVLRDSDVLLDTVGFSGFNTAMQAIECELPVIAWEGRYMRGRLASGTLRAMGMDELVAADRQAYVDLAVALCSNSTLRLKTAARLAERSSLLFRDLAPVRALEALLQSGAR